MKIGYGKLGRAMPFQLDDCGVVGGDVECASVAFDLARRRPTDQIVLIGRSMKGTAFPADAPLNLYDPWEDLGWTRDYKKWTKENDVVGDLDVPQQLRIREWHAANTIPFMRDLDAIVLWSGPHGPINTPLPMVETPQLLAKPYSSFATYGSFLLQGVNAFRERDPLIREEIWLNADPRNHHHMRDLKWPLRHAVLAQFNETRGIRHDRYDDRTAPDVEWRRAPVSARPSNKSGWIGWQSEVRSIYSRLEVNGILPGTLMGRLFAFNGEWRGRDRFGLFINEADHKVKEHLSRREALRRYVLPLKPDFVHGKWTAESLRALGHTIASAPWSEYVPKLQSVRATFTTPSSGSGWATTKPWEAFAAGTVCFFHPLYDAQNHILKDAHPELQYLRVRSPEELARKVDAVNEDEAWWTYLVQLQRQHFDLAATERRYLRFIDRRLNEPATVYDELPVSDAIRVEIV